MAEKQAAKKTGSRRATASRARAAEGFTEEERAAMKDRVRERKATRRGPQAAADGEKDVLAKIAAMPDADRALAERVHTIIRETAPNLTPRTWYGMPAYAKGDKVVCFFQDAHKFKSRYATLGFSDKANLDAGPMWPVAFALTELTPEAEGQIRSLVEQAVS